VTSRHTGSRRCPSLAVWLGLVASLLLMVGGVWDIAWHHTLGRDTFWSPPHLVLYSGVGVMGLVCLAVVLRTTGGRSAGPGADSTLVELWGLRAP
jgi:predicted acyltransferase